MPWDAKYAPETDALELKHVGNLSTRDTREQAQLLSFLMYDTQATRFLLDYSETISQVPDEDVRTLPEYCERLGTPLHIRVALVVPLSIFSIASFQLFAQAARERGFSVELFPTRARAEAWLRLGEAVFGHQSDAPQQPALLAPSLSPI